jgi:hypothetical protein
MLGTQEKGPRRSGARPSFRRQFSILDQRENQISSFFGVLITAASKRAASAADDVAVKSLSMTCLATK